RILSKPTSLTDKEYKKVKKHPILSTKIIKRIPLAQKLIPIIKYHHENYDGTGYPSGLKGSRIPIGARILAIADVYDALTSRRAYREAYSHNKAIEIMKKDCGKKFDPEVFKKFVQITNFIHRKHYGKNAKLRTRAVFINYRDRDNKWK
ncbi:MAG: HD domain-containing protein, partial [Candidatus Omnitrophica bacterium]|nr:HD domain-containing protein [Candidatus Omnitrophota bacterium]